MNGLVYEHQIVAEKKIGRPLKCGEIVHHKDRNRSNNDEENILIFASHSDHAAFHKGAPYVLDDEGIAHCDAKTRKGKVCPYCGKEIFWTSKTCADCSHMLQRRVSERPSREQLKALVRQKPFLQIASMYGVSDNTIKKWCYRENIPNKTSVIRDMSDEEWLLV
jgi:hypothetical protein